MTHPFSAEYIRMARAAEEIQAMRPDQHEQDSWDPPHPAMGSIFAKPYKDGWEFRAFAWLDEAEQWQVAANFHESDDEFIWLPLLHQLLPLFNSIALGIYGLNLAYKNKGLGQIEPSFGLSPYNDPTEIALDLYMWSEHSKRWDGKAWMQIPGTDLHG